MGKRPLRSLRELCVHSVKLKIQKRNARQVGAGRAKRILCRSKWIFSQGKAGDGKRDMGKGDEEKK